MFTAVKASVLYRSATYTKLTNYTEILIAYNLEECKVAVWNVVEVDLGVDPGVVHVTQRDAIVTRRNDVVMDDVLLRIDALLEPSHEQVHSHDAEDEPEDEADEQHVEDGWYRLDQRVDDHLYDVIERRTFITIRLYKQSP